MKRILIIFFIVLTWQTSIEAQPQIAYRIFSDYVQQEEEGSNNARSIVGGIFLGVGSLSLSAGGVAWFFGDQIAAGNPAWTPEVKTTTSLILAGVGIAGVGAGLVSVLLPPLDLKSQYSLVFGEIDPVVQEAMAAAALKDASDRGRDARITGAIVNMATPVLTLIVQSIINVSMGRDWYHNYQYVGSWQIPSMVISFSNLFGKSQEERMYEKYLAAKSAIYATE